MNSGAAANLLLDRAQFQEKVAECGECLQGYFALQPPGLTSQAAAGSTRCIQANQLVLISRFLDLVTLTGVFFQKT